MTSNAPEADGTGRSTGAGTREAHDLDAWDEALADAFLGFDLETAGSEPFHADLSEHGVGDTRLVAMTATPHRAVREGARIEPHPGYHFLGLQLAGYCDVTQDGRTARIGPGDMVLCDSSRPVELSTLGARDAGRGLSFRFRADAAGAHRRAQALTATRLSGAHGLTPALAGLLTGLYRGMQDAASSPLPPALVAAARSATELARCLLDDELSRRGLLDRDHPRDAMRAAIDRYIDRHLTDPALSPRGIAAGLFISPRHLYALLSEDGRTVAGTIRQRRLERCLADLADPRRATDAVSEVGARWGIPDPSRFARIVKDATGSSPVAYRRRMLGDAPT